MSKYEVINEKGKILMQTNYAASLFDIRVINSILKAGYKIKKEGKVISKKDISEELSLLDNQRR